LGWSSAGTNLTAFIVRYGIVGGTVTRQLQIPTNSTIAVVSNLTAGATFFFNVSSLAVSGLESLPSNQISTNMPGTNHAPVAISTNFVTQEDQAVPAVLAGFDPDGDELSFQVVTPPAHGTLSGTGSSLSYTPAANYAGADGFTYLVTDGVSNSSPATVTLTIAAVNDLPTLSPLANLTLNEDAGLQTVNLSGIGAGLGESQTLTVTASSSNPSLIPQPSVSYTSPNSTGSLSFTPVPNASGVSTISVSIDDGGASNNVVTRTFTVTVSAVNDPPTLDALTNRTVLEDAGTQMVPLTGISPGPPNEAQTLTFTAASSDPSLIPTPAIQYTNSNPTGVLLFTPAANRSGTATLSVTVDDGQSQNHAVTRSFLVQVLAVNDPPTLTGIEDQNILMNTSTDPLPFVVHDEESAAGNLSLNASSSNPTLLPVTGIEFGGVGSQRAVRLTPAQNQIGSTTVGIVVSDGAQSTTNHFVLTVRHGNYQPTLDAIGDLTLPEDASDVVVPLSGISSGATNEDQLLVLTATSSNPAVLPDPAVVYTSPASTGSLRLTPVPNRSGTAVISVTIDDGGAENATRTRQFLVTVTATNDAPTISAVADQVTEPGTATRFIPFTIDDVDSPLASLQVSATSSNATLLPAAGIVLAGSGRSRSVQLRPLAQQLGQTLVTLSVNDGSLTNAVAFLLTVTASNHPPVISAIADQTMPAYGSLPAISFRVGDAESAAAALMVTGASSVPSLLPSTGIAFSGSGSNRTVTLTPARGKQGVATVALSVSDGQRTTQTSFRLTVSAGTAPQSVLTLLTQGSGMVTPNLNGQSLTVGQTYALTAVPAVGCLFTGWTGGLTSSAATLQFIMRSNLVLHAGFMTNPFTPVAGLYNGLFYEDYEVVPGSCGFFTLKTTEQGAYSGKLMLGAKSLKVSGHFDFSGRATNDLVRKGTNNLALELLLTANSSNRITGWLSDGTWTATLLGDRSVYHAKTNPAPFAGQYTLVFPGAANPADGPEGHGYGTVKVDLAGRVTLAAALADGAKAAQKVALSQSGVWPLYVPLYKGLGQLLSWQTFSNLPSGDVSGSVNWTRPPQPASPYWPSGFTQETITVGSSYVRPGPTNPLLQITQTTFVCQGGNISPSVTHPITVDAQGKITIAGGNPISISVSPASGLFSGKLTDATGHSRTFRGAVLQKQVGGAGFLLGTNRSAQVFFGW
jgi:hypothetical protein